jgi:hypothetical protein
LHNNAEEILVDRLGRKEPEFGSYAGQLAIGPREREFEEIVMV